MRHELFQLLYNFNGAISEKHIKQALSISGREKNEELEYLLNSDKRFVQSSDACWECIPLDQILDDRPIESVDFIITDIETTGSIKGKDRIIEIGAVKLRNKQTTQEFQSLINPQKKISKTISRLTKINNQTIKDSPIIENVLPDFIRFSENGIFVAHNSFFDFSFINAEIERLQMPALKTPVDICTFRLARKLLPNVRARGISGLSLHFDYHMENRHRAMPDVLATQYFFCRFLSGLEKRGIKTLHELISFQRDRMTKKELLKKIRRIKRKRFPTGNYSPRIPN